MDLHDEVDQLRRVVKTLEQLVRDERARAEIERRRADVATEASRRAWSLAWALRRDERTP
jgi:hypothetical protein